MVTDFHQVEASISPEPLTQIEGSEIRKAMTKLCPDMQHYMFDSYYLVGSMARLKALLAESDTHKRKYESEIHDCDDFSKCLYAEMDKWDWTGFGRIVDFSGGHSYNAVAVLDQASVEIWLVEPQSDKVFHYAKPRQHPYLGQKGYSEW